MANPTDPTSDELSESIERSKSRIRDNIDRVNQLELSDQLKDSLRGILEEVHDTLEATQPILDYLDEVRSLIIAPVQTGVERAFRRSNRWGVLGIVVGVVSMSVSVFVGVTLSLFQDGESPQTALPIAGTTLVPPLGTSPAALPITGASPVPVPVGPSPGRTCNQPEINAVLSQFPTREGGPVYVVGDCFPEQLRVQVTGFDVRHTVINEHLLRIDQLPPPLGPDEKSITVAPIVSYEEKTADTFPFQTFGRDLLQVPDIAPFQQVEYELNDPPSFLRTLALKKDIRTVLGNSDSYFGQSEQPTGTESPSIEFLLEEYDPFSHQNGLYVVIEAAGIGPGGGSIDYVHPSGVYVNSTLYDFSSWPYWADERAARVQGRFAIRISANDLTEGTNTIKFVGGQYRGIGDRVEIDNYIVFSFAVATLAQ